MTKFDYIHNLFKKQLSKNGSIWMIVKSESMTPMINKGESVEVHSENEYEVGDIVVYRPLRREYYIVHRIIRITKKRTYLLKGDCNYMYDEEVEESRILGKVISVKSNNDEYGFSIDSQRLLGNLSFMWLLFSSPFILCPGEWKRRIYIMKILYNIYYWIVIKPISHKWRKNLCLNTN